MKKLNVLAPFNGISCGRVAAEYAELPIERYVSYEIDENANKVAKFNYPNDEYNGDVFEADFKQYNGFDLLIGGSPCTYWSVARTDGKRELTSSGFGWELFMQYYRALNESKAKYFLYENNNSMSPLIKEEITKKLGVEPLMVDSGTVSAQSRKRLYWTNIPITTELKDEHLCISDILETNGNFTYIPVEKLNNQVNKKNYMQYDINGKGNGSQDQRAYYLHGKCGTLDTGCSHKHKVFISDNTVREFTQLELERLQTLPEGYTSCVSKNKAGKAIGNGWTAKVIAWFFENLKIELNK